MGLQQLENILDVREKLVYSLPLWNPRNVGRREIITRYKQGPFVSVILLLAGNHYLKSALAILLS